MNMRRVRQNKNTHRQRHYRAIPNVDVGAKTSALLGFAIRSRQVVLGFEAVRRAAVHGKLAGVLAENGLSPHTLEKLRKLLKNRNVPLFVMSDPQQWNPLKGAGNHKIIGLLNRELGRTIIDKIKAGA